MQSCDGNVIVHPGIDSRSEGNRRCQTDDNSVFQNQYHMDNHCVTQDGSFYSMGGYSKCDAADVSPHVFQASLTRYVPVSTVPSLHRRAHVLVELFLY
jgi:hypothetical protein